MREVSVLFKRLDDGTDGPVVAVQDHFGKVYRNVRRQRLPGDIVKFQLFHSESAGAGKATGEGLSDGRVRIIAPVRDATVRALLRRSPHHDKPLIEGGSWYEVICD